MKPRMYVPSLDYLLKNFFVTAELPDPSRVTYSEHRIPVFNFRGGFHYEEPTPDDFAHELIFKRERLSSAYARDSFWVWHKIEGK